MLAELPERSFLEELTASAGSTGTKILSAWPDQPVLDTHRTLPSGFAEMVGPMNALDAGLLGLVHEAGQFAQLREIIAQAQAAA